MAFQTVIYYLGYCVALFLFKDMGRLFFAPMLFNLWFNLLITFELYRQLDFRWLIAFHGVFWLAWVLSLARVTRSKTEIFLALVLLCSAFTFGTLPHLLQEPDASKAIIDLSTRIWTIWYSSAFLVVLLVIVRSTVVARVKGEFVDILTSPMKRFLIPMGVCSGVIGLSPLLSGTLPEAMVVQRFNIGSQLLVWGWVAFELPFFIQYERMKRNT